MRRRGMKIIDRLKFRHEGVWHEVPVRLQTSMPEHPFLIEWTLPNGEQYRNSGNNLQVMQQELVKRLNTCSGITWKRMIRVHLDLGYERNPAYEATLGYKTEPCWIGTRKDGVQVFAQAEWDEPEFRGSQIRVVKGDWAFENSESELNVLVPDTAKSRAVLKGLVGGLNGLVQRLAKALQAVKDEESLETALNSLRGLK